MAAARVGVAAGEDAELVPDEVTAAAQVGAAGRENAGAGGGGTEAGTA